MACIRHATAPFPGSFVSDLADERTLKSNTFQDKGADCESGLKDEKAQAKTDREKARAEEKVESNLNKAKEELAGSKAKAVNQEAKDAIAEGQTKGELTVVLGKLKAN